jgi:signal transduction histidine kinase
LSRKGSFAVVEVSDTGEGISADFLPHVFERRSQATERRFSGLGLGLAIVKHIIELHRGSVEARSEGEGKGSTFTVRIPCEP